MVNLPKEIVSLIVMIISVITTTIIIIPIIVNTQIEGQLAYVLFLIPVILNLSAVILAFKLFLKN